MIDDSDTHAWGAEAVEIRGEGHLTILAGRWNDGKALADLSVDTRRPLVTGDWSAHGDEGGSLTLSGLLMGGEGAVLPGDLAALGLYDVTNVGRIGVQWNATGPNLGLEAAFERCLLGALQVEAPVKSFTLADCIVDGNVKGEDLPVSFDRTTVYGSTNCERVDASDSIFARPLVARRTQVGCVRFCFVPPGSRAPRVYRCQPDLAIEEGRDPIGLNPSFVSTVYGDPAYMMLSDATAPEILAGASNGDEMGAYNRELHTLREANLRFALQDTLRVGLEAGIFHGN